MRTDFLTEWRDQLEHLTTKELLDWAREKDFFVNESFVWDTWDGLDSKRMAFSHIAQSRGTPDELLPHLSRNDAAPLPGDRRRRGGGA
jgi:hypothetical protein